MTMTPQVQAEEVTREEVRPGLTMIKRRTLKDDGRYLYYYDFERGSTVATADKREEA
jgi:hypothetical protein